MTQNPTPSPSAPQGPTAPPIGIDVQVIMDAYLRELAQATSRAILAEASVTALQAELAEARATIHALSPGAPTTPEG